jgi:hypothetical protein
LPSAEARLTAPFCLPACVLPRGPGDPVHPVRLSTLQRFRLLSSDHLNELVTVFLLVVIPTFLVPLSILLRVMSLNKLMRAAAHLKTSGVCIKQAPILDVETPPAHSDRC